MVAPARLKNKSAAPTQVTAEQILPDSPQQHQKREEPLLRRQKWKIPGDRRLQKRRHLEDWIRRVGRDEPSAWVRYARWEESWSDLNGARSVWERALGAHRLDHTLYLELADFEIRNGFVSQARNVWERAVTLFPRVDELWFRYLHMEEVLQNFAAARKILERWMLWEPEQEGGWFSLVNPELRYKEESDRVGLISERLNLVTLQGSDRVGLFSERLNSIGLQGGYGVGLISEKLNSIGLQGE